MKHESANGVVVRVRDTGDHDRYLSVLTAEYGRITVLSKGSRSMRGEQMSVSQLYTYANFEFYRRGSLYILKGGSALQSFYALTADIDRINLAAYLCDLTCELTDEGEEAPEMLRLLLNALYAVSHALYPQELIKGAFELRAAALSGYAPSLEGCAACGEEPLDDTYFDIMNGALLCADCLHEKGAQKKETPDYDDLREAEILQPVNRAVCAAMRYCIDSPIERLLAFGLTDPADTQIFATAAETYVLSHVGHGFDTLDFYKALRIPKKGTNT